MTSNEDFFPEERNPKYIASEVDKRAINSRFVKVEVKGCVFENDTMTDDAQDFIRNRCERQGKKDKVDKYIDILKTLKIKQTPEQEIFDSMLRIGSAFAPFFYRADHHYIESDETIEFKILSLFQFLKNPAMYFLFDNQAFWISKLHDMPITGEGQTVNTLLADLCEDAHTNMSDFAKYVEQELGDKQTEEVAGLRELLELIQGGKVDVAMSLKVRIALRIQQITKLSVPDKEVMVSIKLFYDKIHNAEYRELYLGKCKELEELFLEEDNDEEVQVEWLNL